MSEGISLSQCLTSVRHFLSGSYDDHYVRVPWRQSYGNHRQSRQRRSPGAGTACTQASPTVALSAGSVVAGHLETPAGIGLGAREEMGGSF